MPNKKLKVGSAAMVYNAPDGKRPGVVVAVNAETDAPGKLVGVRLDDRHPVAHECDGLCEKGHGWWTRPELVAVLD